jgi:hypothetical protein
MSTFWNFKELLLQQARDTEFDVATGKFADLEIHPADQAFHYFFDTGSRRLIKSFVLRAGPQVDTMCDVVLIKKDGVFTPRLNLWKKDKTKGKPDTMTEVELVAEGRTILIKSRVDAGDCHENFWKLIDFLRTYKDIELPQHEFRVAGTEEVELVNALHGHEKTAVLTAVKTYLGGQVTEQDVRMLLNRRAALERFEGLLTDSDFFGSEESRIGKTGEGLWQAFFEENAWIFGYGLTLVACSSFSDRKLERITTGSNVFTGGGKRSDAVMRTKGFIQTLLFAEIKKHDTELLMAKQYREPDVYQVSAQLSGAVSQVQKTAHKAIENLASLHRQYNPDGRFQFEVSTIRPREVVVVGNLGQLADDGEVNIEKMTSFELYRRDHQGVEIVTFDELYERAKYIVESQEADPANPAS